ncbi:MAG: cytochrome c4 [Rhodocyclaceae bacterium]|nr:cytochrome c4 [Rhodocyclaceae bacterium]
MTRRSRWQGAALLSMVLAAPVAGAGDSAADIQARIGAGDPAAGKDKSAMCQGCHGADGNSAAPNFPKLAGQYADYISKQVIDYQKGVRQDPTMTGMAAAVASEQDLHDIAAYFASQKLMKGSGASNDAGRTFYLEGDMARGIYGCVNCHGEQGKGKAPDNALFPVIGGQHKDYLVKQLNDLKGRARSNDPAGMMADVARKMTDEDIAAVAEYLAAQ